MGSESRKGEGKCPSARKTIFGWAIMGANTPTSNKSAEGPATINLSTTSENTDAILSRFWEIEKASLTETALTPEEQEVEKHYDDSCCYSSSGRYCHDDQISHHSGIHVSRPSTVIKPTRSPFSEKGPGRHFRLLSRSIWTLAMQS